MKPFENGKGFNYSDKKVINLKFQHLEKGETPFELSYFITESHA